LSGLTREANKHRAQITLSAGRQVHASKQHQASTRNFSIAYGITRELRRGITKRITQTTKTLNHMPPKSSKPKPIASRQSVRRKVHPTKSPYFEHPSEDDIVDDAGEHSDDYAQSDSGSDFREDNAATVSDMGVEEAKVKKDANKSKKRGRASSVAKPSKKSSAPKKQKNDDGVIFIPYRTPSPGGIDYADDQIHPNTLKFLEGA
jgi:hypothetical protein